MIFSFAFVEGRDVKPEADGGFVAAQLYMCY